MKAYDHNKIEKKWQKKWIGSKLGRASDTSTKKKHYVLDMFPYPSGDGLHMGHVENFTATDIYSRYQLMRGLNVMHPMGWDAFGLPAENFAIKTGVHPAKKTLQSIKNFKRQLISMGLSHDWQREINTSSPEYYKWTQWFFLLMYKKGLAEKRMAKVNWCPSCQTVLANEQTVSESGEKGVCVRCGTKIILKDMAQWFFKITDYADALIDDLDKVDWPESTKIAQKNWIGRSEGALINFPLVNVPGQTDGKHLVEVFTTRPDTLFGATFLAVSAELAEKWVNLGWQASEELKQYIKDTIKERADRDFEEKEKTGVFSGLYAINPANNEQIPVWVVNYVLGDVGTGAIMAVPAHDERDWDFAKKYNLPVREVVVPQRIDHNNPPVAGKKIVERRNVHVIVRNPATNKYLILKWKKQPWVTFPMGGIEAGEGVIEAAKREVLEETGYKNLKFIKILGGSVRAEYFARHKDENRVAFTNAVMFDLVDEARDEVSQTEKDAYELEWISKNEIVSTKIVHAELNDWLSRWDSDNYAYTGSGVLVNSGKFDGMESAEAKKSITEFVGGKLTKRYKLRDWLISRQRYWGAPIPVIYCDSCGEQPVPEKDLPVKLPTDVDFRPTGESPLVRSKSFHKVKCPKCGKAARREPDTMDTFVCSSWYYYRFADPKNKKIFADKAKIKKWLPVDLYMGGAEHTVLHLMYARFFTKVLKKYGYISFDEPFAKLRHQGIVLAEDGRKMSKSLGNVVNPDEIVRLYGADTARMYIMFMGPLEDMKPWNSQNIIGVRRFLEKVWRLAVKVDKKHKGDEFEVTLHKTIKKVGEDIESLGFNTAISAMMMLANEMEKAEKISVASFDTLLKILAPFAPHLTDELWSNLGHKKSIHLQSWPEYEESKLESSRVNLIIQINGKTRDSVEVDKGASQEMALNKALERAVVQKWVGNSKIHKVIYVPGRLLNLVV